MRLGVAIEDTWDFFHDIYAEFQAHHQVSLFQPRQTTFPIFNGRLNARLFQQQLQRFLQTQDAVFFEWSSRLLAAASHLPKTCPIITRMHRYEMYQWADQVNWANVDKLIVVSQAKRDEFVARFPQHAGIVEVITEGIDLSKFTFRPKPFHGRLGILCHLRPRKRVYELILAFSELSRLRPELHLYVGGGSASDAHEYPAALHQLVERCQLQDKVTFDGKITDNAAWYDKIDIFISNAYSEGWQVSLIEAMASGCYALSHQWAGADERMPAETLYYTDAQLQQAVLAYCQLPEPERQAKVAALRHIAETECDIRPIQAQIRQLVEAVWQGQVANEP